MGKEEEKQGQNVKKPPEMYTFSDRSLNPGLTDFFTFCLQNGTRHVTLVDPSKTFISKRLLGLFWLNQ